MLTENAIWLCVVTFASVMEAVITTLLADWLERKKEHNRKTSAPEPDEPASTEPPSDPFAEMEKRLSKQLQKMTKELKAEIAGLRKDTPKTGDN